MKSGTMLEYGEIVLVPFPYTDMSKSKLRPVLIISNTSYNKTSSDFVCCGITSNTSDKSRSILINNEDMVNNTLQKKSKIKFTNIYTLQKDLIEKRIGKLDSKKLDVVISSIINMIS